ncbi:MAG: hypothetical protein R2798_14660 [Chitinophagales bacterium]
MATVLPPILPKALMLPIMIILTADILLLPMAQRQKVSQAMP